MARPGAQLVFTFNLPDSMRAFYDALEAACRGRAIVGGNRAGIPDVVHDDENGLLVDPDDADALATALVRILGDKATAVRLGAGARETGEEWGITPGEYAAKVRGLVDAVLAG